MYYFVVRIYLVYTIRSPARGHHHAGTVRELDGEGWLDELEENIVHLVAV